MKSCIVSLLATLFVSGTAFGVTDGYSEHDPQVREIMASVSWESPTVVEVELGDHRYTPDVIELPLRKPVILRLRNVGAVAHDMVGGSLFGAVLVRNVTSSVGRVVAPYLHSVYIRAGQSTDIWLLPLRPGEFSFFCSISGHREQGMEGRVTIR